MEFLKGVGYNFRGLFLGLKTPRLLLWGLLRFVVVILLTFLAAWLIFAYHSEILEMIWHKPASQWILWLWHVVSWILSLTLFGLSAIFSYLVSQIFFSVLIMDHMSRITERMTTGRVEEPKNIALLPLFFYLIKQEIPRSTIPVLLAVILLLLGWVTPLGPFIAVFSSGIAAIFLAWDNTDLIPARRMNPFSARFRFLLKTLPFHLGFGILFLIPGLNLLLLSFAPVGATLYHLEKDKRTVMSGALTS
ncbi:MAG: EI24 domain-containing protein [Deltaproteobacteria bacterium]|nr:EI24 domain-containing protein [Deltaproteobacteria bacterium]